MAKKRVKNELALIYGDEPVFDGLGILSQSDQIGCFTWYNNCVDYKKKKLWTIEWAKKNGFKEFCFKQVPDSFFGTLGALARMISRGYVATFKNLKWMKNKLTKLLINYPAPDIDPLEKTVRVDPSDILLGNIMYNFDLEIDNLMRGQKSWTVEPISDKLNNKQTKELFDYYQYQLEEVQLAYAKKDVDFQEAYDSIPRRVQSKMIKLFKDILSEIEKKRAQNTVMRKTRKPRTKKVKPADKLIEKLNYQNTEQVNDLILVSIDPVKIIGAQKLVIYNTKYRKIGIYCAKSQDGFSVKGSTLQNFDPDTSETKTLRKPELQLTGFINAPRVRTDKVFDVIKSKPVKLTGRLNNNTIILKVF